MKIVWTPAAVSDLTSIIDYIEIDLGSPKAAERFYLSVMENVHRIAEVPGSAINLRLNNGIHTEYQYVLVGNWMVFFKPQNNTLLIVRILYSKSDHIKTFFRTLVTNNIDNTS